MRTFSVKCKFVCWSDCHSLVKTRSLKRAYSTGFKKIEKINATAPQPQRNVL